MTPVDPRALLAPDDDRPAPGGLVAVQALVNSLDRDTGADALASPASAAEWLRRAQPGARVSAAERERLVGVREALRDLLAANAGLLDRPPPDAVRTLRDAGGRLVPVVGPDGSVTVQGAGSGVDRFLGDLLAALHEARLTGTWPRLKACADPTCRWAFYDASRNRAGAWCSMAECGNRAKTRRFRARRAR